MGNTNPQSKPSVTVLAAELDAVKKTLAARDKTIKVLTARALEKQTGRQSSFGLLEENSFLQDIVARKTVELEEQNHKTEEAHEALLKAQNELLQAQKLESVGRLAAGIAHEINTPTQYIADNVGFIRDSFPKLVSLYKTYHTNTHDLPAQGAHATLVETMAKEIKKLGIEEIFAEVPKAIEDTLEGVNRVTKIIHAMKEFSHPGSKEKSPANLNKAIQTTVEVTRNEWKYVADVELQLDEKLPAVPCFVSEFNQCILNLIVNAAQTIGEKQAANKTDNAKGKITISTRRDGDWAEIRVTDTGKGIPEANRSHIFEPFYTTKDIGKGTGQGLTLVYMYIVKKHKGTVAFESQEGVGTTFILRLPLVEPLEK